MSSLIHSIYSSTATGTFKEHGIPGLLEQIRKANESIDVTGMLLYIEGSFFQVLEGEPTVIDALIRKIQNDARHERFTLIIREPILERNFGGWTMGFEAIGLSEAGELLGENDFFVSASCVARLNPGRAKKLLSAFRDGRWRTERTGAHRAIGRRV
jgi:Sensors of blue-light using FAD